MDEVMLIERKINNLIKLFLTIGVQPSELADNIFLNNYKRISFEKQEGYVVGELVFEEELGSTKTDTILRYYFVGNKVTLIEEETFNGANIIWDREYKESELINDIVGLMKRNFNSKKVANFIKTLPDELSIKIKSVYNKIA